MRPCFDQLGCDLKMMNKKEMLRNAGDPKYISGIYNYCDRWCEHCRFTSKCLNHSIVEEEFGDLEKSDEMNEAFWRRFSEMLQNTLALINDLAREHGIDIDSTDLKDIEKNESNRGENAPAHLFFHLAKSYEKSVDRWFAENTNLFDEYEHELNRLRLISADGEQEKDVIHIRDALEVIRWYQYQINIKLKRAVQGTSEAVISDSNDLPKDSDGSAKVALIGIDRSLSAWGVLLNRFAKDQHQIHRLMKMLENIRKRIEAHFPRARDFVRPGFDTESVT